jgi:hypothetical protein
MKECTQQEFESKLSQLRDDPQNGLSGPLIDSAPVGNVFRSPFKEYAWTIGNKTVLQKTWTSKDGWRFYSSDQGGDA